MLSGNKILSASLAVFLFRDRAISLDGGSGRPLAGGLIPALREFLSIRSGDDAGDYVYTKLFEDDSSSFQNDEFELVQRM